MWDCWCFYGGFLLGLLASGPKKLPEFVICLEGNNGSVRFRSSPLPSHVSICSHQTVKSGSVFSAWWQVSLCLSSLPGTSHCCPVAETGQYKEVEICCRRLVPFSPKVSSFLNFSPSKSDYLTSSTISSKRCFYVFYSAFPIFLGKNIALPQAVSSYLKSDVPLWCYKFWFYLFST